MMYDLFRAGLLGRVFLIGVPAILALMVCAMIAESEQWSEFKTAHNCKIVGRSSGDLLPVFSSNGSVSFASTPDKTGWACDDGVTYWQ